ncbi:MAG: hypothetical protein ACRCWW_09345 [Scandinavium sp.]|uniref:hypothetical protein n=1 Tax=Scandinavium sp. TaxID=2830653 RepID=UPI003F3C0735
MLYMDIQIYSDDRYLKYAVDSLKTVYPGRRQIHFIDVDIFPTIKALRDYIYQETTDIQRIIFISRGMLLAAVLAKEIDIHISAPLIHWRACINRMPGKERECALLKLDNILTLHRLTYRERLLAAELRRSTSLRLTARTMDYSVKQLQTLSMSIYRKMNLKNTNQLHFVLRNLLH